MDLCLVELADLYETYSKNMVLFLLLTLICSCQASFFMLVSILMSRGLISFAQVTDVLGDQLNNGALASSQVTIVIMLNNSFCSLSQAMYVSFNKYILILNTQQ